MTLYRSTLLLLTCVTFLGVIPESARSSTGVRSRVATPEARDSQRLVSSLRLAQAAPADPVPAAPTAASATLSSPSSSPSTTLQPGARGPAVQQLQNTLKLLGYYEGPVDGNYGQTTEVAVLNFQKAIGLTADGVAGPSTLSRLQELQTAKTKATKPTPTSTSTPAKPKRSWIGWLIGVVAIAGAGTGILYLFTRNHGSSKPVQALPSPDATTVSSLGREGHASEVPNQLHADTVEPEVEVSTNGHSAPVAAVNSSKKPETANAKELPVRETTKLSKINIVEELIKDLRNPDPAKRRKAIWELGQRGDTQAVQPLVDLMIDSDSKQRSLILASLSEIGVRTLKPMNRALAISLQDENPEVRKNAIRDVTRIYDLVGQISQLLRHATEDPDAEVQETARWALNQVNRIRTIANAEGVPALKNSVSPPESLPENISEP